MQFILLVYSSEADWSQLGQNEIFDRMRAYENFIEELTEAGVLLGGNQIQSSAMTKTVRHSKSRTTVRDRPHSKAKKQLAGFFVLNVSGFAEATRWAAQCPGARYGVVEVRPLGEPSE